MDGSGKEHNFRIVFSMVLKMQIMKNIPGITFCLLLIILLSCSNDPAKDNTAEDKDELLQLEYNWLKAEFALDTGYLSTIMDSTFIGISENGIKNKREELIDYFNNISQRIKDSIIVDTFNLENTLVNFYNNTAVVTFVVHTHGRNKSTPTDRKTRFYDTWIKRDDKWKAVASIGVKVAD
jgi:hypothetical protein